MSVVKRLSVFIGSLMAFYIGSWLAIFLVFGQRYDGYDAVYDGRVASSSIYFSWFEENGHSIGFIESVYYPLTSLATYLLLKPRDEHSQYVSNEHIDADGAYLLVEGHHSHRVLKCSFFLGWYYVGEIPFGRGLK